MMKPFSVFALLVLSAWSYFQISVSKYTEFWRWTDDQKALEYKEPSVGRIVNWVFFYTILAMALICLFQMVYSSPGYVPYDYKYKRDKMSQRDAFFYQKLL